MWRRTSLDCVTRTEETTLSTAEVVDLLGQDLAFPLLGQIADVEVTRIHDVGYHHPLGNYKRKHFNNRQSERKRRGQMMNSVFTAESL